MAIKIGTVDADQAQIYVGTQEIAEVYIENTKVWPDVPAEAFMFKSTKQTNLVVSVICSVYNTVTINWGDGTTTLVNDSNPKSHTYATAGEHTINIVGDLTKITKFYASTQSIFEINLHSDLINLETILVEYNTFTSLIIPETCVKLGHVTVSNNTYLTDFQPNQLLEPGININFYVTNTSIKHLYYPTGGGANHLINGQFTNMLELLDVDFTGIEYLTHTHFYFGTCPKLTSIYAPDFLVFTATSSSYSIVMNGLPELVSVLFPKCTTLTATGSYNTVLNLSNCPKLTTIDFSSLEYIKGGISLGSNPLLNNADFPELTYATDISTANSIKLQSVYFPKLSTGNPSVYLCSSYGSETYPLLSNINFSSLVTAKYILIRRTICQYLNFPALTTCSGLIISYNSALLQLNCPVYVTKSVYAGSFNAIEIVQNPLLQLIDLPELKTFVTSIYTSYLSIQYNNSLITLNMSKLENVDGALYIQQNPNLTSAINLSLLTTVKTEINISYNSKIPSVNLSNLTTMNGNLYLRYNTIATSLALSSTLNGATLLITDYSGYASVYVPSSCTTLQSCQTSYMPNCTSVTCDGGYNTLAVINAVNNTNLISATYPTNAAVLGKVYVYNNAKLTTLTLPTTVGTVNNANYYLYSNPLITSITLPNVLTYNYLQITSNTNMTSISIHNSTTSIKYLYVNYSKITSLSANITTVDTIRCENITTLSSVNLPNLVGNAATVNFGGCTNLSSLNLGNLTTITTLTLNNCNLSTYTINQSTITTLNLFGNPNLTYIDLGNLTTCTTLNLFGNPAPTVVGLSDLTSIGSINFQTCNFSQAQVDSILADCLTISLSDTSCSLYLTGTNAKPSAQGYLDKATLISRGWTVSTN